MILLRSYFYYIIHLFILMVAGDFILKACNNSGLLKSFIRIVQKINPSLVSILHSYYLKA